MPIGDSIPSGSSPTPQRLTPPPSLSTPPMPGERPVSTPPQKASTPLGDISTALPSKSENVSEQGTKTLIPPPSLSTPKIESVVVLQLPPPIGEIAPVSIPLLPQPPSTPVTAVENKAPLTTPEPDKTTPKAKRPSAVTLLFRRVFGRSGAKEGGSKAQVGTEIGKQQHIATGPTVAPAPAVAAPPPPTVQELKDKASALVQGSNTTNQHAVKQQLVAVRKQLENASGVQLADLKELDDRIALMDSRILHVDAKKVADEMLATEKSNVESLSALLVADVKGETPLDKLIVLANRPEEKAAIEYFQTNLKNYCDQSKALMDTMERAVASFKVDGPETADSLRQAGVRGMAQMREALEKNSQDYFRHLGACMNSYPYLTAALEHIPIDSKKNGRALKELKMDFANIAVKTVQRGAKWPLLIRDMGDKMGKRSDPDIVSESAAYSILGSKLADITADINARTPKEPIDLKAVNKRLSKLSARDGRDLDKMVSNLRSGKPREREQSLAKVESLLKDLSALRAYLDSTWVQKPEDVSLHWAITTGLYLEQWSGYESKMEEEVVKIRKAEATDLRTKAQKLVKNPTSELKDLQQLKTTMVALQSRYRGEGKIEDEDLAELNTLIQQKLSV